MMTRLTGAIAAILLLGFTAVAAPSIHVDNDTYDFGTIPEGYAIEHTFVLTNDGDETLIIDNVKAPCGCTTAELATKVLEPGESVDLRAVLGTTGYGGQTVSKTIYVYSNDPRYGPDSIGTGGRLTLYIKGTVLRMRPYNYSTEELNYYAVALVDVRSPAEFASGHFVNAVNVPLDGLPDALERLPRSHSLILYDADGTSALTVIEDLHLEGFPSSWYLAGGLAGWTRAFGARFLHPDPTGIDYGTPAAPVAGFSVEPSRLDSYYLYVLIDLRSPEAFAAGHVIGATSIPLAEFSTKTLERRVGAVPWDTKIFVYDQSGQSADPVAEALRGAGYPNARSLLGGLDEWSRMYGDDLMWKDEP